MRNYVPMTVLQKIKRKEREMEYSLRNTKLRVIKAGEIIYTDLAKELEEAEGRGRCYVVELYDRSSFLQVTNRVELVYWPHSGVAGICDGGLSDFFDARGPRDALERWLRGESG